MVAAAWFSTLHDMVALIRSLLPGGPTLLKPETIALMMTNQLPDGQWIRFAMMGEQPARCTDLPQPFIPKTFADRSSRMLQANSIGAGVAGHAMVDPRRSRNIGRRDDGAAPDAFVHPFSFEFKRLAYEAVSKGAGKCARLRKNRHTPKRVSSTPRLLELERERVNEGHPGRCAIITPAIFRFGEIHHCVPATRPNRIRLKHRMIDRRRFLMMLPASPCTLPAVRPYAKRTTGVRQLVGHHQRNRLRLEQVGPPAAGFGISATMSCSVEPGRPPPFIRAMGRQDRRRERRVVGSGEARFMGSIRSAPA